MTAPQQPSPEPIPPATALVAPNPQDPSGTPSVLVRFSTGAGEFTLKLAAEGAPQFMANLTQGVMQAAQAALAAAGPRLAVPNGLVIPGHPLNGNPRRP